MTPFGQEALAPIFGLRRAHLDAIINDHSGELQRRALIIYKTVAALERIRRKQLKEDQEWYLEWLTNLYNENQAFMLSHGFDPGRKPL